jgi:hypothetical protein
MRHLAPLLPKAATVLAPVAALAEAALAWAADLPAWAVLLFALSVAVLVVWACFGIRLLALRRRMPDRREVRAMRRLQSAQQHFNLNAWRRLDRAEAALRLALASDRLCAIEARLDEAAARIEGLDAPAAAIAAWHGDAQAWLDEAAPHLPSLADAVGPITPAARERARDRLPVGRNLSSADLKAMIGYLAEAEQISRARQMFDEHRAGLLACQRYAGRSTDIGSRDRCA